MLDFAGNSKEEKKGRGTMLKVPGERRFLTARWRRLVMLNYEVDPGILRSRTPVGTQIDTWNGRCLVSMVGFQFVDTRIGGIAVPFHRNFLEVNLRFYVRRKVNDHWRRGVVFVKELVPRWAVAWVANTLYHESYQTLPMSCEDTGTRVRYAWKFGTRSNCMAVSLEGVPNLPESHSEESFITEHYWGYTRHRGGATIEYRVDHPPWRVWRCSQPVFDCDISRLYGPEFVGVLEGKPASSFLAEGSEVVVYRGVKLT